MKVSGTITLVFAAVPLVAAAPAPQGMHTKGGRYHYQLSNKLTIFL
jgi:hypothetical protein